MCGIAGCYQQVDGRKLADVMTDRIAHRGPDAGGVWSHEDERVSIHLGHRRLSIIDLSTAADQPLVKDDLALRLQRRALQLPGAPGRAAKPRARPSSPPPTPRSCSRRGGTGGRPRSTRFRGMFAFALADTATGELVLARDPLGIKPLLYIRARRRRRVRLRAQGARRGPRLRAADRAGRAGRVHALLLGARAAVRHPGRAQAPGRHLGAVPPGRHASRCRQYWRRAGRGGRGGARGRPPT